MKRQRSVAKFLLLLAVLLMGSRASSGQVQQLPPGTTAGGAESSLPADATAAGINAAETQMAAQDWMGALARLTPVLQREPGNAQALYDAAFCHDALNETEAAKSLYARASKANPQSIAASVGLGLLLARNREEADAIVALQRAVTLTGTGSVAEVAAKAQAYRALARLHLQSAPTESRDDLLQALRLSAETTDDVQLAGEIAEALQDDTAAATAYARVLAAAPDDPTAAAQLARVQRRLGKTAEAKATLSAALAAHPADAQLISEQAGVLLQERNVAEALPLLERLRAAQPDNAAVARLLARADVAQGDYGKADALFRQLAAATPQDGDLLSEWADSLIRQKRSAEAQPVLERAVAATFSSPSAKARAAAELAFAASVNHQPQVVLRAISIRSETEPLDATTAFLLATARDTLHQSREAAGAYRQFLELANGKLPDEEWQAKQRLQILSRAK